MYLQGLDLEPDLGGLGWICPRELLGFALAGFERATAAGGTVVMATHRKPILTVLAHVLGISYDCVPASGVTPLRVMLCVVHYAVRAWVVSITSGWVGRVGRAVGSGGVSRAMEVSER